MHLVVAAQHGDNEALDRLLRRHLPSLRAFVRARSGQAIRAQESCSDLVQTVCREALKDLGSYQWRGEGSFRHWLFSVAVNKIRGRADYYAAQRRDAAREIADRELANTYADVFGPSQHAIASETIARFEAALDELSDEHREIILLSRIARLDHAELAAELKIEPGAVRTRLSRALTRLATIMAGPAPDGHSQA